MTQEAPVINNIETWNYFRLYESFIKNNCPEPHNKEDIKRLILNKLFVTSEELELLAFWAFNLDFKLKIKLIKVDGVYYLPINIPGSDIPSKGIGNEYIDKLKATTPINIDILYD